MTLLSVFCFSLLASAFAVKTPPNEDFYMAAVLEYHPMHGENGNATLQLNAQEYSKLITEAAKYADIVVFPEAALLHSDMSIFLEVPFSNDAKPAVNNPDLHPVLKQLSESARNNSIYVALNLHEKEINGNSTYRYNTDVVFDRNGTIVAKYRKYNLFSEVSFLNITKSPERVYFDTDFGVRFGIFTCFDILFQDPTLILKNFNVTDYLFLTWWFSELPFLTAVQEQAAWSYSTDSNLLASGGNLVNSGTSGSGIYAGKNGPVIYTQSNWNETALLTAKIFKKNKNGTSTGELRNSTRSSEAKMGRLKMKTDHLEYYKTLPLTPNSDSLILVNDTMLQSNSTFEGEICQSTFCCHYSINMTFIYKDQASVNLSDILKKDDGFHHHEYRVGIFDGVRSFDGYATGGVQVCGVIPCLNRSQESCGLPTLEAPLTVLKSDVYGELYLVQTKFESLHLKTMSLDSTGHTQPNVLLAGKEPRMFGSLPPKLNFYRNGRNAELNISSDTLGSAAIFSRVFSRDGQEPGVSSAFLVRLNVFLMIITFIVMISFF